MHASNNCPLYKGLSFTNTFDIAVWAIACVAFWGLPCLGEVTVPSHIFDAVCHALHSTCITWNIDKGVRSVSFDIPWTKTTLVQGATLYLTEEPGNNACPYQALQMHLTANQAVPSSGHLFGFATIDGGWQPMVKLAMMERCEGIWKAAQLSIPSGHSFRIGGTSHHLSQGTDIQIVQKLSRWSSDAFYLYWRNAQAIIPIHIASAAERDKIHTQVEKHLEGADSDVMDAWKSIQASQDWVQGKGRPGRKK